jgi:peptide/nickel transport system ATP-binding protein
VSGSVSSRKAGAGVSPADADTPAVTPTLQAEHLVKSFRGRGGRFGSASAVTAVNDVSLELYRGRILALVGESGCGKSTVARLLSRLYPLTSGSLRLEGKKVSGRLEGGRREYTSHVQIILQDPFSSLNSSYTIRHHLMRPLRLHGNYRGRSALEARATELLEEVNLRPGRDYLDRYPHELSGGQRQRVSIARALAVEPDVLLADEPVSMLDVSIRLDILRLLETLTIERSLALLYITHDIASARYFARDTAVMYAAELVEFGPSEAVTQQPAHPYTRLLVSAAPNPDRAAEGEAVAIGRGEPPSLAHPPTGCRFHPRCPFAMDVCKRESPPSFDVGTGHWAKCWLFDDSKTKAVA